MSENIGDKVVQEIVAEPVSMVPSVEPAEPKPKMYTKDEVAKIANAEKLKAYEKAKTEFDEKVAKMAAFNEENLDKAVKKRFDEFETEKGVQGMLMSFGNKVKTAEQNHPDFVEKVQKLTLSEDQKARLILLAETAGIDNAGEVLYELASNPDAFSKLNGNWINQVELAKDQLHKMSKEIKEREKLSNSRKSDPIPTHTKPAKGHIDSGFSSVSDFRLLFKA